MLVETFDDYVHSSAHSHNYHLLHHMMEDMQWLWTISASNRCPYEYVDTHVTQTRERASQKRQILMIEDVNVIQ